MEEKDGPEGQRTKDWRRRLSCDGAWGGVGGGLEGLPIQRCGQGVGVAAGS